MARLDAEAAEAAASSDYKQRVSEKEEYFAISCQEMRGFKPQFTIQNSESAAVLRDLKAMLKEKVTEAHAELGMLF